MKHLKNSIYFTNFLTFFQDWSSSKILANNILINKLCFIHQRLCKQCEHIHIIIRISSRIFPIDWAWQQYLQISDNSRPSTSWALQPTSIQVSFDDYEQPFMWLIWVKSSKTSIRLIRNKVYNLLICVGPLSIFWMNWAHLVRTRPQ